MKHSITTTKKGAFSILEILVVIAVIGIIAAIVIPNIGRKTETKTAPVAEELQDSSVPIEKEHEEPATVH